MSEKDCNGITDEGNYLPSGCHPAPETERTKEVTGHDLRGAIDDLFSVRGWLRLSGARHYQIDTETTGDWDNKHDFESPIRQTIHLLERPYEPKIDKTVDAVPGFGLSRELLLPEKDQMHFEYEIETGDMRYRLYFDNDGSVESIGSRYLPPEQFTEENFGEEDISHVLTPVEIAAWHSKLISPDLTLYERARAEAPTWIFGYNLRAAIQVVREARVQYQTYNKGRRPLK